MREGVRDLKGEVSMEFSGICFWKEMVGRDEVCREGEGRLTRGCVGPSPPNATSTEYRDPSGSVTMLTIWNLCKPSASITDLD